MTLYPSLYLDQNYKCLLIYLVQRKASDNVARPILQREIHRQKGSVKYVEILGA